mmetsp:Transcript_5019/g.12519  ORF Transcript_5019/g.12519 Transcript_5019/m.12519 type:complete len:203 (+) Transcript_5019:1031-1639(+)
MYSSVSSSNTARMRFRTPSCLHVTSKNDFRMLPPFHQQILGFWQSITPLANPSITSPLSALRVFRIRARSSSSTWTSAGIAGSGCSARAPPSLETVPVPRAPASFLGRPLPIGRVGPSWRPSSNEESSNEKPPPPPRGPCDWSSSNVATWPRADAAARHSRTAAARTSRRYVNFTTGSRALRTCSGTGIQPGSTAPPPSLTI